MLKAKDAIVDRIREVKGSRPDIDTKNPGVRLYLRIYKNEAEISIDIGGGSLHQRGYRSKTVTAPIRENLAAAVLYRAGWQEISEADGSFYDPFCGSGTLCIEAALMAGGIVPGAYAGRIGVAGWKHHDSGLWKSLVQEYTAANSRAVAELRQRRIRFFGSDSSEKAIKAAEINAAAAGLGDLIQFSTMPVHSITAVKNAEPGLVATNPPYGERLESETQAQIIYCDMGTSLRKAFPGWRLSFLAPDKEIGLSTGIQAQKIHKLANGPIPVQLIHGEIPPYTPSSGTEMFVNRLKKNRRLLQSYLKKTGTSSYRLYDKDMPEYAFAIDIYEDRYCHLQEYAAPSSIEEKSVRRRRREAMEGLLDFLDFGSEAIFLKERRRLSAHDRYAGQEESEERYICREGSLKFYVNFTNYLDTGIFLDSRELRRRIAELAPGKRFLNLFSYTCTASVTAAAAGATATVSVDTSAKYLKWGEDNLRLNGLSLTLNRRIKSDTVAYLKKARAGKERFDLIYVDPPTYSNSKDRRDDFDLQRDHRSLLDAAARLLNPEGTIIFCTNFTRFEPDRELFDKYKITETTSETVPPDFSKRGKIHRSFLIKQ